MATLSTSSCNVLGKVKFAFIDFPSAKIYKETTGSSWYNHLLFGDYVKILDDNIVDGRVYARSRGSNGWVNASALKKDRILEINFIDIGVGDGCHVVTPDDRHIIIDAGKTDNMIRYLTWRFNLKKKKPPQAAFPIDIVISHSDSDHYLGFSHVFREEGLSVGCVYHNGLVERPGASPLGRVEGDYITGIVNDTSEMKNIIVDPANLKGDGSLYCKTLNASLKNNPAITFKALSAGDGYLGDFDPQKRINDKEFSIKILAPVRGQVNGKEGLRTIKDLGKDKNGHSVILRIKYGNAKVLLGGDVNEEFGKLIHEYYTDNDSLDDLKVDVAKACHHGSNHFSYEFVEAINAAGTVISSGDDESYSHPRPDAIGTFGKCGYGRKPLVFSTELARSNKEITKNVLLTLAEKTEKIKTLKTGFSAATDNAARDKILAEIDKLNKETNSFLTKYGMINLRTDGNRMIIAQKYEKPSAYGKWDIHELKYSPQTGRFELVE
jgi:beta-lactamase superfamily II metal-dependent hydrolase